MPFSAAALRFRQNTDKAPTRMATNATSPIISPAVSPEVKDLCSEALDVAATAVVVVVELDLDDLLGETDLVESFTGSGCEKDRMICVLFSVQKAEVTWISVQYRNP